MADRLERARRIRDKGLPAVAGWAGAGWQRVDILIGVGILAVLLFPVGARLWADRLPIKPPAGVLLAPLGSGRSGAIRSLPEFVTLSPARVAAVVGGGPRVETAEINRLLVAVFGLRGARRIERRPEPLSPVTVPAVAVSRWREESDLGALLIEVTAQSEVGNGPLNGFSTYGAGGRLALAVLNQAARGGGCAPRLNLAFLLAAEVPTQGPASVQRAFDQAVAACPDDPTALWALGEYQSVQVGTNVAAATFAVVERRFPRLGAAWSGAGDNALRRGYSLQDGGEPFAARQQFARALALYRRAEALDPGPESRSGVARAQAELGQADAAVTSQRRVVASDPRSAVYQAWLLDYLQRGHEFATAARVAARLAVVHRFPAGPALFADVPEVEPAGSTGQEEDADQPISTGAGTMAPVWVELPNTPAGAGSGVLTDLSYLPLYLPMSGVGGLARWCPRWTRLIDLILSGSPAVALTHLSGVSQDLRLGNGDCSNLPNASDGTFSSVDVQQLAGVAELDLGRAGRALAWGRRDSPRDSLSYLQKLRENLLRYAGSYRRAATAAAQWAGTRAGGELALLNEGEIAFLRHRYNDAATYFAVAVNDARYQHGAPRQDEAAALLDQGTALAYAGRHAEALATLSAANQTAITSGDPLYATYAEEEAGYMALTLNDPAQAAEDYTVAAASAKRAGLAGFNPPGGDKVGMSVLDNNLAIAEIATGVPATAAVNAKTSIHGDPGDGIFWWTEAAAYRLLGDQAAAITAYRTALADDPGEFPVANNLGVLLMKRGADNAAVAALRRSVGADPRYAIGWFNLGIALDRLGAAHLLAAAGSLARADQLDSELATRAPRPFFDNATYVSGLDLSKPLPPKWTFASSQVKAPVTAAGLSAILLITLTLARALAARAGQGDPSKWLGVLARIDRRSSVAVLRPPVVAIAATAAFLLWPLHGGAESGWAFTLPYAAGLAVLLAVVVRVRQIAGANAHVDVHQETWLPGVGLGLVLTLVGLGWAPLPVVRARGNATSVHWAAPTAIAVLAIALLVLAAWLNVSVTRGLGAAALLMAASMLTPVKPLDGATVSADRAGALPGVAVLGTAVLLVTGLL